MSVNPIQLEQPHGTSSWYKVSVGMWPTKLFVFQKKTLPTQLVMMLCMPNRGHLGSLEWTKKHTLIHITVINYQQELGIIGRRAWIYCWWFLVSFYPYRPHPLSPGLSQNQLLDSPVPSAGCVPGGFRGTTSGVPNLSDKSPGSNISGGPIWPPPLPDLALPVSWVFHHGHHITSAEFLRHLRDMIAMRQGPLNALK